MFPLTKLPLPLCQVHDLLAVGAVVGAHDVLVVGDADVELGDNLTGLVHLLLKGVKSAKYHQ